MKFLSNFSEIQYFYAIKGVMFLFFQLPVKFEECSVEMQKYLRLLRQPKSTQENVKEIKTTFDPRKYL